MATTKTQAANYREANYRRASRRIEQVHARLDEIDRAMDSDTPQDWSALLGERRELRAERDRLNETITRHNVYARGIR